MSTNLDAIIKDAIQSEADAAAFYAAAAEKMTDASAKALFNELADEERSHEKMLAKLDLSAFKAIPTYDLPDYKTAEGVDKPVLSVEMSFADAIALAMKNEEEAMLLYASLAKVAEDAEQKKLFQALSDMEKGHKARLEGIYNNAAYAEVW